MRRRAILVSALLVASACSYQVRDVAPPIPIEAQSSRIYAADGTLLVTLHAEENRENVRLAEIPLVMQQAVIAIEDERFYRHNGVDFRAILRAAERNADAGDIQQGGSTITQQYVKTAMLDDDSQTLGRKLEEATLALELERKYSKERILELYLNTVYFGNGAYGVQAAARQYFGKSITKVSPAEAALLAGLIQAPSRYDPFDAPEAAIARRTVVLDRMVANDMLKADAAGLIGSVPLQVRSAVTPAAQRYPAAYFVEEVKQWVLDDPRFGDDPRERRELLFGGGLRIHTTVDLGMQAKAEAAVAAILPNPAGPERVDHRDRDGHRVRASDGRRPRLLRPGDRRRSSTWRPRAAARQARRSSRSCSPPRSSTASRSPTATPRPRT